MRIAEDIKTLGEDIVASYDGRIKAIGTLVRDTHQMLKGFDAEHKQMSEKLRADLSKGDEDRLKNFKALMGEIKKFVGGVVKETASLLKKLREEHNVMADELKHSLAKGETERLKEFKALKAEIEKYVDDVVKYVDDVVKTSKRLMDEIRKRQKERNTQVADLLEAYKTERERMATNWQNLVATMAKRRGGKQLVSAGNEVKTVAEAIEAHEKAKGTKSGREKRGKAKRKS